MFCENPNGRWPCGKCRACKLKKANEKMLISVFAAAEFKVKGQFLTLTYNDEHLPYGLQHKDFSGFMKRLRRNTGVDGVKMFMAGEYGSESGREHFHVLFYNHKFPIEEIQKAWSEPYTGIPFGFVYDGTLTPKAMKYVSGYIDKKGYDPGLGKRPPYGRSSCGLPDNLSGIERVEMCKTGKIRYNGRVFSVPSLWRKRYHDMWKWFENERKPDLYENPQRFLELYEQKMKSNALTPKMVSDMMDARDRVMALKRLERKKAKRLI